MALSPVVVVSILTVEKPIYDDGEAGYYIDDPNIYQWTRIPQRPKKSESLALHLKIQDSTCFLSCILIKYLHVQCCSIPITGIK